MTKRTRPPRSNRATDPFGGPRRGPTSAISTGVVLVSLAILLIIQFTSGDIGGIFNAAPAANAPTLEAAAATSVSATSPATPPAVGQAVAVPTAADETPAPEPTTARATAAPTSRSTPPPSPTAQSPPTVAPPTVAPTAARVSNLPTIAYADLPPQAHDTIRLIEQGGPFPFRRDGITFQNRERLLPRHPEGYYREYTVITPGENDRGARRIVTGEGGEMYYTDDHYDSFREIVR